MRDSTLLLNPQLLITEWSVLDSVIASSLTLTHVWCIEYKRLQASHAHAAGDGREGSQELADDVFQFAQVYGMKGVKHKSRSGKMGNVLDDQKRSNHTSTRAELTPKRGSTQRSDESLPALKPRMPSASFSVAIASSEETAGARGGVEETTHKRNGCETQMKDSKRVC